jgi:hypothetical protein
MRIFIGRWESRPEEVPSPSPDSCPKLMGDILNRIRNSRKIGSNENRGRCYRVGLTEVTNMIDAEYLKERQIWIERYRALERQVTDPLAALLVHDIVLDLEESEREQRPSPTAPRPDAPKHRA